MSTEQYRLEIIEKLSKIPATQWNALLTQDASPFLKHEFLSTLEETHCVGGNTGWQVAHLGLYRQSELIGAMPLYLKQHSYGEFVFDWSWAQAYQQQGMQYYPKALCAIPFSPVQGSRILCLPNEDLPQVQTKLIVGLKTLVLENNLSSAHILFPQGLEASALAVKDLCSETPYNFIGITKNLKVLSIFYPH